MVHDYLSQFESLANHTIRLPAPFLLSYFLSNLISEIRREVQALRPLTLVQATTLARLHEEKINDHRRVYQSRPPSSSSFPPYSITSKPTPTTPLLPSLPKPPPIPIKRLSPEEMASRQERGLCFNCNKKFSRGHKCPSKFFLLIVDNDDYQESDLSTDMLVSTQPQQAQISLHAMSVHLALETLHLLVVSHTRMW